MKKIAIAVLLFCVFLVSCEKDNGSNGDDFYCIHTGVIKDSNTQKILSGIDVVVTDGKNIHSKTLTKEDGSFSIGINVNQINNQYYIQVGNVHTENKKVDLIGFGNGTYDLGVIFIEGSTIPQVITSEAISITANSAVCGGNVLSEGGFEVYQRGVCYSTEKQPTIEQTHTSDGRGLGEFSTSLTNLKNGTLYYVRAYAINSLGVAYGEELSFKTEIGLPMVLTSDISEVTATTIACGGIVLNEGGATVTRRGICWSTTNEEPEITDTPVKGQCGYTENGSGIGNFESTITGVDVTKNSFYLRAYATNQYGTTYGAVKEQLFFNPFNLPIIDYGNVQSLFYMVLPYDLAEMPWMDALDTSSDLVAYGYDDWFLPNADIYKCMYDDKEQFGDISPKEYWTIETAGCPADFWSDCWSIVFNFNNGKSYKLGQSAFLPSRPIRKAYSKY